MLLIRRRVQPLVCGFRQQEQKVRRRRRYRGKPYSSDVSVPPYRYSSTRDDQSGGPSRFSERATRRNDSGCCAEAVAGSIVRRTRVFGSNSIGSSGRNTFPSKIASKV